MARTKQTARGPGQYSVQQPLDEEDQEEINAILTEEDKKRREELEKAPMQIEVKHLEKRWTKKGHPYITEPKEDEDIPQEKINWYEKYALCITRQYDGQNKYICRTSLEVNSPGLKNILGDVIGSKYPGQSYLTSNITVDFPPRSLYHYRQELADTAVDHEPGSDEARHLPLLLSFIGEEFHDAITDGANLLEQGLMSYEHLWTIFRPGCLVYATRMSQARVYKLNSYQYTCGQCPGLQLSVEFVDFDGDDFGTRYDSLLIPAFSGTTQIASLNALPLAHHPDPNAVSHLLTERGRRWEALAGQNFRQYKGVALDPRNRRFNIDGRVMVDAETHHRIMADYAFNVNSFPKVAGRKRKQDDESDDMELVPKETAEFATLTDEQCLLASPMVRGFSFTEKKFLDFFVDKISPIEWNTQCFEQLVLPDSQKELVQALVAEHTARTTDPSSSAFDDIVKGKGKGLILVLHGPPGVGKTLTAECVAEFSRRPLYIVSSGDLGTSSAALDDKLTKTLDLASTWKAVLLIDEADVFLERRSLHDMERNSLVSIFLRTLEYYSGILFMTTNRVRTFDDAFKSRIHVPLKYDDLPRESRLKVWKNFLGNVEGGVDIDEDGYEKLAEGKLNGRQIKNVVRTAKSLAAHKKRRLDCEQLQQVVDIQMTFERELDSVDGDIDVVVR
ncbi:AAA family ATPase [Colletotrichum scovillei]|uniref:AAA family ATPase n=1 Tax=Colletotrichum scovillei TaxID=1209932 RepID=A0A9P7RD47_9PEZI|nr:AAA family ATPase [Colletotrichum scovillei]KAF4784834.1 AAA family ATPase [Colletotrichum scovillei]KAG7054312.1 AAA family ATPase [Colletotrichum scovillei]KAG7072606.1 AAA family ATPase [Colletotrichum scovillei]KAG7080881.1 AAA family ATPase [Colletotrichum scovillei]